MIGNDGLSRRTLLVRLGLGFNMVAATILGVPIVR
jgi:hypothetical protein